MTTEQIICTRDGGVGQIVFNNRITSYNVCYTKLLRNAGEKARVLVTRPAGDAAGREPLLGQVFPEFLDAREEALRLRAVRAAAAGFVELPQQLLLLAGELNRRFDHGS